MADFNKYYDLQSQGLSGFHGPSYQKGHGLGSIFKRLFRWVIPIIKQNAAPILNTTMEGIKSSVSDGLLNFEKDMADEKMSIKDSAKRRIMETFEGIKNNFKPQSGQGARKKRKRIGGRPPLRRHLHNPQSIFDV